MLSGCGSEFFSVVFLNQSNHIYKQLMHIQSGHGWEIIFNIIRKVFIWLVIQNNLATMACHVSSRRTAVNSSCWFCPTIVCLAPILPIHLWLLTCLLRPSRGIPMDFCVCICIVAVERFTRKSIPLNSRKSLQGLCEGKVSGGWGRSVHHILRVEL